MQRSTRHTTTTWFATFARNRPSSNGRTAQSFISSITLSVIREIVSRLTEAP